MSPFEEQCRADVVLLGGSISALSAACHFKLRMPDLDVMVLGPRPENEKRPIVGESTIEPTIMFFQRIGLGDYLQREHAVKHGLSFYHKLALDDPGDRRYSVHAPEQLYHLSRQLDRPRFDCDLRDHAIKLGVRVVEGKAARVECGSGGAPHRLQAKVDGQPVDVACRWLIDATGRSRAVGRQVTTYHRPQERQRSCFWFRLADFHSFLESIEVSQRRPFKYDLWNTTHHFYGRGNWIWGIPLQSPKHDSLISIGITYRPDLFGRKITSMDDFLSYVDGEHPAIAETVRSGKVIDQHVYGNYFYSAEKIYSPDGWFLIGDAAHAVDPLYSTGLALTVIQIEQIGEIISRQRSDGISAQTIEDFERLWMTFRSQRAEEVTRCYECMHDPFQACMRRYWAVLAYFNAVLPLWHSGMFHNPEAAPVMARLFEMGEPMMEAGRKLIAKVSKRLGNDLTQAEFDRAADFDWLLNHRFDCPAEDAPVHFGRMFHKRALFRWRLLKAARFRCGLSQLPLIGAELALSQIMPHVLRRKSGGAFLPHDAPSSKSVPAESDATPADKPEPAYQETA